MSYERLKRKWYTGNYQHVTRDHEWDFDHFHGPSNRMQNTYVHGPGVVSGLEVDLAVRDGSGNVEVKIRPGGAIDRKGDLISLSPLGFAASGEAPGQEGRLRPQNEDVSPQSEGESKWFAINGKLDDWPAFVTIQFHWRQRTSDDSADPPGPSLDLQPWLRIQTEARLREDPYNQDHPPVLLAQLVKDEQTGKAELVSAKRELIATSLGALRIRRPTNSGTAVSDELSATIGPGDHGGLRVGFPKKKDTLSFCQADGKSLEELTVKVDKTRLQGTLQVEGEGEIPDPKASLNVSGDLRVWTGDLRLERPKEPGVNLGLRVGFDSEKAGEDKQLAGIFLAPGTNHFVIGRDTPSPIFSPDRTFGEAVITAGRTTITGEAYILDKLDVTGDVHAARCHCQMMPRPIHLKKGATINECLSFDEALCQKVNLWKTLYGMGVQHHTMYFRSNRDFAWYQKGSHHNDRLNPGGGSALMVLKDGKLGVNHTEPRHSVHVSGSIGIHQRRHSGMIPQWGGHEAIVLTRPGDTAAIAHPQAKIHLAFIHSGKHGQKPGFWIEDWVHGARRALLRVNVHGAGAKRFDPWGSDYAEYFESADGQPLLEGTSVEFDEASPGKIRPCRSKEVPLGIVSAMSGVICGAPVEWPKKYLRDESGKVLLEDYQEEKMVPAKETVTHERQKLRSHTTTRMKVVFEGGKYRQKEVEEEVEEPVFQEVDLYDSAGEHVIGKHQIPVMETFDEVIDVLDDDGNPVFVGTGEFETKKRPKLNPEYDESQEYIPRQERPEWNCVGLLGQIPLRKGQPTAPNWLKIKDLSEDVELWLVR